MKILKKVFKELFAEAKFFVKRNIKFWVSMAFVLNPTIMMFLCEYEVVSFDFSVTMMLTIHAVLCLLKKGIEVCGLDNDIPVPNERFTEISEDGEVSVNYERLQEMLIYMADLEDYLEMKGLLYDED